MDPKAYWVGFNYVKGIGAVRMRALLDAFDGDLKAAWEAPISRYQGLGLSGRVVENILRVRSQINLEQIWDRMQAGGIQALTWDDDVYPRMLKEIDQPPPVLYQRGEVIPEDETAVAIVGTRRVTAYGRVVTEELAAFLARNRITVVSGLARGVDALAHRSALQAGGRTLAVLGSGIDRIYPPENQQLAMDIADSGALLSDYPPGTAPESTNFPPRNRIISGLSLAVVVIEAGATSGALITASFAADQNRDVLAVPGNINSPNSKGTNMLIQNGARPYLKPEDLLEVLNLEQVNTRKMARRVLPADATETQIIKVIAEGTLSVDEISFLSGLPVEVVSATLAMMELKGLVRNAGSMSYMAIRDEAAEYYAGDYEQ
jgi:DNA processing protein